MCMFGYFLIPLFQVILLSLINMKLIWITNLVKFESFFKISLISFINISINLESISHLDFACDKDFNLEIIG